MISSMDKMWASFIGMALMVLAAFLITFARMKTKGVIRWILTIVAFALLLLSVVYMLVSMS